MIEDDTERPDWDDKVAVAQMLEYEADRAETAEERLDALVADLRTLANGLPFDVWRRIRAVLDKHAGEQRCHADRDGDCAWTACPQLRDGEPVRSGRHCPIDTQEDGR